MAIPDTCLFTNECRRGNEVSDIPVDRPSFPEARGLRAPALGIGGDQCDRFPDARSATALLMLPRGEVPVQMDNIGRPQPVVLDPAEPGRNDGRGGV